MNRIQNESVISSCSEAEDGGSWQCTEQFSQSQENGWIEIMAPPVYVGEGQAVFLQILPSPAQSDGLTYPHIALINTDDAVTTFITSGLYVVTEIIDVEEDGEAMTVWYKGTEAGSPSSSHLYKWTRSSNRSACVTCTMLTSRGQVCQRNSIDMNYDMTHYIHTCSGPVRNILLSNIFYNFFIRREFLNHL